MGTIVAVVVAYGVIRLVLAGAERPGQRADASGPMPEMRAHLRKPHEVPMRGTVPSPSDCECLARKIHRLHHDLASAVLGVGGAEYRPPALWTVCGSAISSP